MGHGLNIAEAVGGPVRDDVSRARQVDADLLYESVVRRDPKAIKTFGIAPHNICFAGTSYDRGAGIRTRDLLLPKQARYQAAPRPVAAASVRGWRETGVTADADSGNRAKR